MVDPATRATPSRTNLAIFAATKQTKRRQTSAQQSMILRVQMNAEA